MRTYLNSSERELIGLINMLMEKMHEYVEHNAKLFKGPEGKYIRLTITYFKKFLVELFRRVGTGEGEKLQRIYRDCNVRYVAKGLVKKDANMIQLDGEIIEELAHAALKAHCRSCTLSEESQKVEGYRGAMTVQDCRLRDLFLHMDIPECDPTGSCPYRLDI